MFDDDVIQRVARAIQAVMAVNWNIDPMLDEDARQLATAAIAALPTIAEARAGALENAIALAEAFIYNPPTNSEMEAWNDAADHIAAAIRSLKDRG